MAVSIQRKGLAVTFTGSYILQPTRTCHCHQMCRLAVIKKKKNLSFPDGCQQNLCPCLHACIRIPIIPIGSPSSWKLGKSHYFFPLLTTFPSYRYSFLTFFALWGLACNYDRPNVVTADSIKVTLGIGNGALRKLLFGGH